MTINHLTYIFGVCCLSLTQFNWAATPQSTERSTWIRAHNSLPNTRQSAATLIPLTLLKPQLGNNEHLSFLTMIDGQTVANQIIDSNGDGLTDALLVMADYPANASINIKVSAPTHGKLQLHYPPYTQTEMAIRLGGAINTEGVYSGGNYYPVTSMTLPPDHKVGDKLFKYEGFGWESDRVAYRFYFDERGLVDIFGKRTADLVLTNVGLDSGDYHSLSDWGMDILKVGSSLGLGGVAAWVDDKVQHPKSTKGMKVTLTNGSLESSALITQSSWPLGSKSIDLRRQFSIQAHSHLTHTQVTTTQPMGKLALGIVKHGVNKLENLNPNSEWNYLATFGTQSLANDALGMMVFFRHKDLHKVTSDEFNELVIINMNTRSDYYFGARWEGEVTSINSQKAFLAYLEQTRAELNTPINVSLIKNPYSFQPPSL